ncbi:unnamed protein product, partial [Staurois parvus]
MKHAWCVLQGLRCDSRLWAEGDNFCRDSKLRMFFGLFMCKPKTICLLPMEGQTVGHPRIQAAGMHRQPKTATPLYLLCAQELILVAVPPPASKPCILFLTASRPVLSAHAPLRLSPVYVQSCVQYGFGGKRNIGGKYEGQPGRGARRRGTTPVCEVHRGPSPGLWPACFSGGMDRQDKVAML